MVFKTAIGYVWDKTPWYVKGIFAFIVIPNFIFNIIVFFFWFLPWYTETTHATIIPYIEKQQIIMTSIVETQGFHNKATQDSLTRIEQHQSVLLTEMLRRSQP